MVKPKKGKTVQPKIEKIDELSSPLDEIRQMVIRDYDLAKKRILEEIDVDISELSNTLKKTFGRLDIKLDDLDEDGSNLEKFTEASHIINSISSKSKHCEENKHQNPSTTSILDDAYTTASSSTCLNSAIKTGTNLPRKKPPKPVPKTNNFLKPSSASSLSTPQNNKFPKSAATSSMALITPKIKEDAPQIVLRRPKQGEMALSFQGSPMFTGTVVTGDAPNVNIPLTDGTVFSVKSNGRLRVSQVPAIDTETLRQLATLRDNIDKICGKN